jgi:hypothetical protein
MLIVEFKLKRVIEGKGKVLAASIIFNITAKYDGLR